MTDSRDSQPPKSLVNRQDADFYPEAYQAQDEISLVDLWIILADRKELMAVIFVVVVGLGAAYAFLKTPSYDYRTVFEIGAIPVQTEEGAVVRELIESPEAFKRRLEDSITPSVVAAYDGEESPPRVNVSVDANSPVVVMSSAAPEERSARVADFHQRIAKAVSESHQRLLDYTVQNRELQAQEARRDLAMIKDERFQLAQTEPKQNKVEAAERALQGLRDSFKLRIAEKRNQVEGLAAEVGLLRSERDALKQDIARLDKRVEIVEARIAELNESAAELKAAQRAAVSGEFSNVSEAMSAMLLTSQVDGVERQLVGYRQELSVEIPQRRSNLQLEYARKNEAIDQAARELANEKEALSSLLAEKERAIAEAESRLQSAKTDLSKHMLDMDEQIAQAEQRLALSALQLAAVQPTAVQIIAQQAREPAGPGKPVILALSIVLGGMLAVFSAFFAAFSQNVRRHRQAVS